MMSFCAGGGDNPGFGRGGRARRRRRFDTGKVRRKVREVRNLWGWLAESKLLLAGLWLFVSPRCTELAKDEVCCSYRS